MDRDARKENAVWTGAKLGCGAFVLLPAILVGLVIGGLILLYLMVTVLPDSVI
jgi:hypothetical protein